MKRMSVALSCMLVSVVALATDFSSLTSGQILSDNAVNIGQFTISLPDGNWTVVTKLEARAGSQGGGSAVPTQLSAVLARVDANKVRALFILRTPASSFLQVSRWNDDPCKEIASPLVKDTMKQTFAMPECFAVVNFDPKPFTSTSTGVLARIGQWLKDTRVEFPEKLLRVYYTKYHGGDFLHANLYLPVEAQSVSAAETWGRGVAAEIGKMVTRDTRQASIPPLP